MVFALWLSPSRAYRSRLSPFIAVIEVALALLAMNRSALDIVTASAARAAALLTILGARPHLFQRVVERDFSLPPPERRLLLREVRSILADSTDEARIQHLTALVDRIRVQVAVATLRFRPDRRRRLGLRPGGCSSCSRGSRSGSGWGSCRTRTRRTLPISSRGCSKPGRRSRDRSR